MDVCSLSGDKPNILVLPTVAPMCCTIVLHGLHKEVYTFSVCGTGACPFVVTRTALSRSGGKK